LGKIESWFGFVADIDQYLLKMVEAGASDLHLASGSPPLYRVNGQLLRTEGQVLAPKELHRMVGEILDERQRKTFKERRDVDFAYEIPEAGRYRGNAYVHFRGLDAVFRYIPKRIPALADLGFPPVVEQFGFYRRGLVLVTGPGGCGKSTTQAALLDVINEKRTEHIITVEDPIEFLHVHKKCIVNQREVGGDTHSFSNALKYVLRQDPDVILVGEMRDLETISTALTAAETGHLVFATLHTQDAPQTIDRIIDVFPTYQQQQVRMQLAGTVQAIVTQQLLPTTDGQNRIPAVEVMVATSGIRNLIREAKAHQIYSAMQAGGQYKMQTMDHSIAALFKRGIVSYDIAMSRCNNRDEMVRLIG
jgi:twitching motility protein PilT